MATVQHIQAQLSQVISRSIQGAIETQRTNSARLNGQAVRDGEATGFVDLAGAGESVADIVFPISFVEKPVFTFGFEMAPGSWLVSGEFPVGTATVASWTVVRLNEMDTYTGARLGIVLTGIPGPGILHYVFKGRSLTNPTGAPP